MGYFVHILWPKLWRSCGEVVEKLWRSCGGLKSFKSLPYAKHFDLESVWKSFKSLPYANFSVHSHSSKFTPYASIFGVTKSSMLGVTKSPKSLPYANDSQSSTILPCSNRWNPHLTQAFFNLQAPSENRQNPYLTQRNPGLPTSYTTFIRNCRWKKARVTCGIRNCPERETREI